VLFRQDHLLWSLTDNSLPSAPSIEDGRTLVPLRAIFEAMGATFSWNQRTQTATASKSSTTVVLKIGSLFGGLPPG